MKKLILFLSCLLFVFVAGQLNSHASCDITSWDDVIDTQAEHTDCRSGNSYSNHPHFSWAWHNSGGWDGGGFMRLTLQDQSCEDDDGYSIYTPPGGVTLSSGNAVYVSWITRKGPGYYNHIDPAINESCDGSQGDEWKYIMWYGSADGINPTLFDKRSRRSGGFYRVPQPATNKNGEGRRDEFGNSDANANYPNHSFRWDSNSGDQWYFMVFELNRNNTKLYVWSQDGTLSGLLATSAGQNRQGIRFNRVRVFGYVEGTAPGSGAYIDVNEISVHNTMPSPPAGFGGGGGGTNNNPPSPPRNLRVVE